LQHDLTRGPITKTMLAFAAPLILGNLLQQFYNIADTFIVGRFLGSQALAAVGSAYTLMTFLTSILLGLCMGSGAVVSIQYGQKDPDKMKNSIFISFCMIALVTIVLMTAVFLLIDPIIHLLQVPREIYGLMREYLWIIFMGIGFTLALLSISIIREVFGAGAFAGIEIPFMADYKIKFLVEAPGGFLVYGIMIAIVYKLTHGKAPYKKEFSCGNCPSAAFCKKSACATKEEI